MDHGVTYWFNGLLCCQQLKCHPQVDLSENCLADCCPLLSLSFSLSISSMSSKTGWILWSSRSTRTWLSPVLSCPSRTSRYSYPEHTFSCAAAALKRPLPQPQWSACSSTLGPHEGITVDTTADFLLFKNVFLFTSETIHLNLSFFTSNSVFFSPSLTVSIQCPIYDLDNNVAFIGMYQTMTKKGAITVQVVSRRNSELIGTGCDKSWCRFECRCFCLYLEERFPQQQFLRGGGGKNWGRGMRRPAALLPSETRSADWRRQSQQGPRCDGLTRNQL